MARPLALVTGASAGIGREIARQLAADHDLILVARREDRLRALADELPGEHRVEVCDLTDKQARAALVERVGDLPIAVLVNNAGFGSNGPFWENDADGEVRQVELNVTALVDLSRRILPGMLARGEGRILNIASTAAFQPGPYMAVYFATKGFVVSFTEALAYELRNSPVTVTAHCPGATASEFGDISGNGKAKLFTEGRVATAEEVAADALAAMRRGDPVRIHGFRQRMQAMLASMAPHVLVLPRVAALNRP
ncbi:MAG: SDR family oxidoreductase [Deltaproteobacteria bacterium]|nr:MAG: SDR family oxidoreductase [Deltaproteobacteria bacterium]